MNPTFAEQVKGITLVGGMTVVMLCAVLSITDSLERQRDGRGR